MKANKYIYILLPVLFIIILSIGCIDKFDGNIAHNGTEHLVIEGNIISDSVVVFQLSRTLPLNEDFENRDEFYNFMDVEAEVSVKGSDGSCWKGIPLGKGEYSVAVGTLQADKEYSLEVVCDGATYTSIPQRPLETTKIESLDYVQLDSEGPVEVSVTTAETNSDEVQYHLWFFKEDWEVRAVFPSQYWYNYETKRIDDMGYPKYAQGWCHTGGEQFIAASTASLEEPRWVNRHLISIPSDDHRLSCLYSFRLYQRNLSKKEYEYYQLRIKVNEEMGGLFTPQPSELPTNISCSDPDRKAIGYIGCNLSVDSHQIYIAVEDVNYTYQSALLCHEEQANYSSHYYQYYTEGKQVSKVITYAYFADLECVDVRYWGANPNGRPEWWPNPYLYK